MMTNEGENSKKKTYVYYLKRFVKPKYFLQCICMKHGTF